MSQHLENRAVPPAWRGSVLRRWSIALAWVVTLPAAVALGQETRAPNFVIILADDLGYGDLGCYDGWLQTPRIDALAKAGLRWTDFHSNGSVCSPTRAAMLTGRYPERAGIPGVIVAALDGRTHADGISGAEWTLPEALREGGYATGLVGKWHLGYLPQFNPTRHGFDRFRGYVSGNVDYVPHIDQAGVADWWFDDQRRDEDGYSTHLITRHAVEFIADHRDQPFFLLVAHEAPHYPYQGPGDRALREPGKAGSLQGQRVDRQEAYREMVAELDRGVGEIVDTLDRLQLTGQTLVWFISDNGATAQGSNLPWKGKKGTVWEGGHRVPAICCWPGRIAAGTTSDALAMTCDVMPTLLELAGQPRRDEVELDGASLTAILQDANAAPPQRDLFWNGRAVRRGQWKLVLEGQGLKRQPLLFDLSEDPKEQTNVAATEPQLTGQLVVALDQWIETMRSTRRSQPSQSD